MSKLAELLKRLRRMNPFERADALDKIEKDNGAGFAALVRQQLEKDARP